MSDATMLIIMFAVSPSMLKILGMADLMASVTSFLLKTDSIASLFSWSHCCTTAWKLSPFVPCRMYWEATSPSFSNCSSIGGMMR